MSSVSDVELAELPRDLGELVAGGGESAETAALERQRTLSAHVRGSDLKAAEAEADNRPTRVRAYSEYLGGYHGSTFERMLTHWWLRGSFLFVGHRLPTVAPTWPVRAWQWFARAFLLALAALLVASVILSGTSSIHKTCTGDDADLGDYTERECRGWGVVTLAATTLMNAACVVVHLCVWRALKTGVLAPFMSIEIPMAYRRPLSLRIGAMAALLVGSTVWAIMENPVFILPLVYYMQLFACAQFMQIVSQAHRLQFRAYLASLESMTREDAVLAYLALQNRILRLSRVMQGALMAEFASLAVLLMYLWLQFFLQIALIDFTPPASVMVLLNVVCVETARCVRRINDCSVDAIGRYMTEHHLFTPKDREHMLWDMRQAPMQLSVYGLVIDKTVFNTLIASSVPVLLGAAWISLGFEDDAE